MPRSNPSLGGRPSRLPILLFLPFAAWATACAEGAAEPGADPPSDSVAEPATAGLYGDGNYGDGVYDGNWDFPDHCDDPGYTPPSPDPDDLLWSSHGGWALWDFCECEPDETPLPVDPRSLVQPGISDGRAVAFNAFWKDCHVLPEI